MLNKEISTDINAVYRMHIKKIKSHDRVLV